MPKEGEIEKKTEQLTSERLTTFAIMDCLTTIYRSRLDQTTTDLRQFRIHPELTRPVRTEEHINIQRILRINKIKLEILSHLPSPLASLASSYLHFEKNDFEELSTAESLNMPLNPNAISLSLLNPKLISDITGRPQPTEGKINISAGEKVDKVLRQSEEVRNTLSKLPKMNAKRCANTLFCNSSSSLREAKTPVSVITGRMGSGKSATLRHLTTEVTSSHESVGIYVSVANLLKLTPDIAEQSGYFSKNLLDQSLPKETWQLSMRRAETLFEMILTWENIISAANEKGECLQELRALRARNASFMLFLDDMDEIHEDIMPIFFEKLHQFIEKTPKEPGETNPKIFHLVCAIRDSNLCDLPDHLLTQVYYQQPLAPWQVTNLLTSICSYSASDPAVIPEIIDIFQDMNWPLIPEMLLSTLAIQGGDPTIRKNFAVHLVGEMVELFIKKNSRFRDASRLQSLLDMAQIIAYLVFNNIVAKASSAKIYADVKHLMANSPAFRKLIENIFPADRVNERELVKKMGVLTGLYFTTSEGAEFISSMFARCLVARFLLAKTVGTVIPAYLACKEVDLGLGCRFDWSNVNQIFDPQWTSIYHFAAGYMGWTWIMNNCMGEPPGKMIAMAKNSSSEQKAILINLIDPRTVENPIRKPPIIFPKIEPVPWGSPLVPTGALVITGPERKKTEQKKDERTTHTYFQAMARIIGIKLDDPDYVVKKSGGYSRLISPPPPVTPPAFSPMTNSATPSFIRRSTILSQLTILSQPTITVAPPRYVVRLPDTSSAGCYFYLMAKLPSAEAGILFRNSLIYLPTSETQDLYRVDKDGIFSQFSIQEVEKFNYLLMVTMEEANVDPSRVPAKDSSELQTDIVEKYTDLFDKVRRGEAFSVHLSRESIFNLVTLNTREGFTLPCSCPERFQLEQIPLLSSAIRVSPPTVAVDSIRSPMAPVLPMTGLVESKDSISASSENKLFHHSSPLSGNTAGTSSLSSTSSSSSTTRTPEVKPSISSAPAKQAPKDLGQPLRLAAVSKALTDDEFENTVVAYKSVIDKKGELFQKTALYAAVEAKQYNKALILMKHEADPTIPCTTKTPPLTAIDIAIDHAKNNSSLLLTTLIEKFKSNPKSRDHVLAVEIKSSSSSKFNYSMD